ncbi:MAG: hypothetical protein Q4F88_05120 [Eubacteriales bacterium]|nr:hypothetical protein [Eubacteriales bacterium]
MKLSKIIKIFVLYTFLIILVCIIIFFRRKKNNNNISINTIEETKETSVISQLGKLAEKNELDKIDGFYYWNYMAGNYTKLKENATREEREKIYNYHKDEKGTLFEMCKKNGDWSLISCNPESFGYNDSGYNERDGLLGSYNYDSIERIDDNNTYENAFILVKTKKENIERLYRIRYVWQDNTYANIYVDLEEEKDITKNKIIYDNRKFFNEENIKLNFEELCLDGEKRLIADEWDGTYYGEDIAVSDNFRSKYKIFLDLFIHYSPLEYNKVTLLDLDINKKKVKFEVDSLLECKKRTYDCEYKLTEDLQLDDMRVSILKEEETEAKLNTMNRAHTFYKYTDWVKYKDLINYTEKFYNKFKENCSYFPDIDSIENNFVFDEPYHQSIKVWDNKIGTIGKYLTINGEYYFYFIKFFYDKNNKLDDVFCKKLPYTNISIEEAKERFLADTELQKELGIK